MDDLPLLFGNASDPGVVRAVNEDSFAYLRRGDTHLFVVADGMGGETGGRIASSTAVTEVKAVFERSDSDIPPAELLARCVGAANSGCLERQREDTALSAMGTTLDLLLISGANAWWAHVGDGRIYRVAVGRAHRLTRDHTRVQQMLDDGLIGPEDAADHPQRNVLNRVVGREGDWHPDITAEPHDLGEGESLVMCSDGLTDVVTEEELGRLVDRHDPVGGCRALIRLARARGAPDNVTVQIVYKGRPRSAWDRLKTLVPAPGPALPARAAPTSGRTRLLLLLLLLAAAAFAGERAWRERIWSAPRAGVTGR
jgi:protein phosphatase